VLGESLLISQDDLQQFKRGGTAMSSNYKLIRPLVRTMSLAALVTLLFVITQSPAQAQHTQATPVMNQYFKMVFSGDISGAPALFLSEPDDHGTLMLEEKFKDRFLERSNGLDFSAIKDPRVLEIAGLFQDYWRDALMQLAPLEQLDTSLKSKLDGILIQQGFASALDDEDRLHENIGTFITQRGYFALSGRTPPLQELMIWTGNEVNSQSVELTDGTYQVDVNFLDDFISYGWSNFATFGMTSTGGWAQKDGLYCLCGHYDLDSEKYELSFLKHETRHYADFSLYPELQAADLEYRSKLTELAYSNEGTYSLMSHFFNSANKIPDAPHPLANWYVVDGLSAHLFDGKTPSQASAWEGVPKADIRQTALLLLEQHSTALAEQGALTTKGVINF
jgi:hypothetical protein